MKKLIAILLVLASLLGCLVACGEAAKSSDNNNEDGVNPDAGITAPTRLSVGIGQTVKLSITFVPEKEGKKPACEFLLRSSQGKAIIMNSDQLAAKTTKTASGVYVFTLKKGITLESVDLFFDDGSEEMKKYAKYRKSKLPSTGTLLEAFDINARQVKLFE